LKFLAPDGGDDWKGTDGGEELIADGGDNGPVVQLAGKYFEDIYIVGGTTTFSSWLLFLVHFNYIKSTLLFVYCHHPITPYYFIAIGFISNFAYKLPLWFYILD
jgi:hypothetical protein